MKRCKVCKKSDNLGLTDFGDVGVVFGFRTFLAREEADGQMRAPELHMHEAGLNVHLNMCWDCAMRMHQHMEPMIQKEIARILEESLASMFKASHSPPQS
jgi:copper homeostasis protein CutC